MRKWKAVITNTYLGGGKYGDKTVYVAADDVVQVATVISENGHSIHSIVSIEAVAVLFPQAARILPEE